MRNQSLVWLSFLYLQTACSGASFHGMTSNSSTTHASDAVPQAASTTAPQAVSTPAPVADETTTQVAVPDTSKTLGSAPKSEDSDKKEEATQKVSVEVVKLGVNFEDTAQGDSDYNDAVLCFSGHFSVSSTEIVSSLDQVVEATTLSNSGCTQKIEVVVAHPDGTRLPAVSYDSKAKVPVSLNFLKGDKLLVNMIIDSSNKNKAYKCSIGTHSMQDPTYAKILLDICNK